MYNATARNRILEIQEAQTALAAEKAILTQQLQESCTHDIVLEAEWDGSEGSIICIFCGLEERDWARRVFGRYPVPAHREVRMVSRRVVYAHRCLKPLVNTVRT